MWYVRLANAAVLPTTKRPHRLGGREVAFHQERRDAQGAGHVVETVARVVGGEEVGGVDVDMEEIADCVLVFAAIETPEYRRGAGVRVRLGHPVQLGRKPASKVVGDRGIRLPRVEWRHQPSAQLYHDLLPGLAVARDFPEVEVGES